MSHPGWHREGHCDFHNTIQNGAQFKTLKNCLFREFSIKYFQITVEVGKLQKANWIRGRCGAFFCDRSCLSSVYPLPDKGGVGG